MYPSDLRYTSEHEWARLEGDRIRVGITQFAVEKLGDIVFIDLPQPGTHVDAMQPFGAIDSVKAASDLYAPLTGAVVEVNGLLRDRPELVNQDPYGDGWMILMAPEDVRGFEHLLTASAYQHLIGGDEQ